MKKYFQKNSLKCLFTSPAYNEHILNIVHALEESGMLEVFYVTFVDSYRSVFGKIARRAVELIIPPIDSILKKRKIKNIPAKKIHKDIKWEFFRFLSQKFRLGEKISDFFWEKSEHCLDRKSARLLEREGFDFFLGIEHGCLTSLTTAKKNRKKTVLIFLSPHHTFFRERVLPELKKFPALFSKPVKQLIKASFIRDRRRDKEAKLADIICVNSKLTAESLIKIGFSERKIINVPLGAPPAVSEDILIKPGPDSFHFIYAGSFSVRKGAHYLIKAWDLLDDPRAHLHIYGENLLFRNFNFKKRKKINFYGHVLREELFFNFRKGNVLVFPTLCDGFGMVVFEAMAQGLTVITTEAAGVSEFIKDGENGFLVPPADSETLRKRMLWCLSNPDKVFQMRKKALETARLRSWEDYRKDFIAKLRKKVYGE